MSAGGSIGSWGPPRTSMVVSNTRADRDFVQENKDNIRELERTHSGYGHRSNKQVLWKPVQLHYPDPSHLRLARATAYRVVPQKKERSTITEKKRCGLTDPSKPWQFFGNYKPETNAEKPRYIGGLDIAAGTGGAGGYFDLNGIEKEKARTAVNVPNYRELPRVSENAQGDSQNAGQPNYYIAIEKQIQTDDIKDREFLSNALKRCGEKHNPNEGEFRKNKTKTDKPKDQQQQEKKPKSYDRNSIGSAGSVPASKHSKTVSKKSSDPSETTSALSTQTNVSGMTLAAPNDDNKSIASHASRYTVSSRVEGGENLDVASIKSRRETAHDAKSIRSHASHKSKNTPYPEGRTSQCVQTDYDKAYIGLKEQERAERLQMAQERYNKLIEEYNRLPVSAHTLRVRNRKINIERELDDVEYDMRMYADPEPDFYESLI